MPMNPMLPLLVAALIAAGPALGQPPKPPIAGDVSTVTMAVRARIVEIDRHKRVLTLLGPQSRLASARVPSGYEGLSRLRAGDLVDVTYSAALAVLIEPAGSGVRERIESPGALIAGADEPPGLGEGRRLEVVATIEAVDAAARTVTLRGPQRTAELQVPRGIDIAKLEPGQEVHALFIEAAIVGIEPVSPERAAAKPMPDHPVRLPAAR
jgi:hypothetical protein